MKRPRRGSKTARRPQRKSAAKPFRLARLDARRQKAVDELLVRVYKYAAQELRDMEQHQVIELRRSDAEIAKRYSAARVEILRAIQAWAPTPRRRP